MSAFSHFKNGVIAANGIDIHYVEHGSGPLVVFCHGWPESWYSWRHQLQAIGDSGFRAVALHMRGYGGTTRPKDIEAYNISHLVGDVVGSVSALGESEAIVVGHDWGGPVAWHSALMRPDIFRAVALLSVPFNPPFALPDGVSVNDLMRQATAGRQYYRLFFRSQESQRLISKKMSVRVCWVSCTRSAVTLWRTIFTAAVGMVISP